MRYLKGFFEETFKGFSKGKLQESFEL